MPQSRDIESLANRIEDAQDEEEQAGIRRETRRKVKTKKKIQERGQKERLGLADLKNVISVDDSEGVADDEAGTEKRERFVNVRDEGALEVKAQIEKGADASEMPGTDQGKSEGKNGVEVQKDERYVWYPNIAIDLNDATRDIRKYSERVRVERGQVDETEEQYKEARSRAMMALRERIPDIDRLVRENRPRLYWASEGILAKWKEKNPWPNETMAMDFLREKIRIDRKGVDKRSVGLVEQQTGMSGKEPVEVLAGQDEEQADPQAGETIIAKGFGLLAKEKLITNEKSAFVNPVPDLNILENAPMSGSVPPRLKDLRYGVAEMLAAAKRLISRGYNLNGIGVEMRPHESGGVEYSKELSRANKLKIQSLIVEIQRQSEDFDANAMSNELKAFLGSNMEKFGSWVEKYGKIRKQLERKPDERTEGVEKKQKESVDNKGLVWYDKILEDLKIASFLDHHLSEDEVGRSDEVMERLRKMFPKLPKLSQNEGTQEDLNRQRLRAAYEYLKGGEISPYAKDFFNTKEEAVKYLKGLEADEVVEVPTPEWKEKITKDPRVLELAKAADPEKWTEFLENMKAMDAKMREDEMDILLALMVIRESGPTSVMTWKTRDLWERNVAKLIDLGIVV